MLAKQNTEAQPNNSTGSDLELCLAKMATYYVNQAEKKMSQVKTWPGAGEQEKCQVSTLHVIKQKGEHEHHSLVKAKENSRYQNRKWHLCWLKWPSGGRQS